MIGMLKKIFMTCNAWKASKTLIHCEISGKYLRGFLNRQWVDFAVEATNYWWIGMFKHLVYRIEQDKSHFPIRIKRVAFFTAKIEGVNQ